MTRRHALLALAALAAVACTPRRIPGTTIAETKDTRAVYEVVQQYRKAMENRDAEAVLALVAPDYFDTAGTPDPADDLDRKRLETSLRTDLPRADAVKLELTIRKIDVTGDKAEVELFYDDYYRVKTAATEVPRHDSDVHRLRLERRDGAWKIVSGL